MEVENLTDSVYAMIVLTYATLAATTYLFGKMETRARDSLCKIDKLKKGECKQFWDQQPADEEPPLGAPKPPITKVREEYDTVRSGDNAKVERWPGLQIALFTSVSIAAVLLLPVLLLHMNVFGGLEFNVGLGYVTKTCLVIEQIFASFSVPVVGLNIAKMSKKLKRIERLEYDLDMLASALRMAKNGNGATNKPPKPVVVDNAPVVAANNQ